MSLVLSKTQFPVNFSLAIQEKRGAVFCWWIHKSNIAQLVSTVCLQTFKYTLVLESLWTFNFLYYCINMNKKIHPSIQHYTMYIIEENYSVLNICVWQVNSKGSTNFQGPLHIKSSFFFFYLHKSASISIFSLTHSDPFVSVLVPHVCWFKLAEPGLLIVWRHVWPEIKATVCVGGSLSPLWFKRRCVCVCAHESASAACLLWVCVSERGRE